MVSSNIVMGIEWTFLTLAYALVLARIYVRLRMRRERLKWADCWLLIALMSAQGLVICDTITYSMNAMDNFTVASVSLDKVRFATNYFFDTGLYFPKFSIIAFYYSFVPVTHPGARIALHVIAAITVASALVTFFGDTFWCGTNLAVNWSRGADSCSVFAAMDLMRLNWALNITTDVLNSMSSDLAFPFPLISTLKLPSLREKVCLVLIFSMGVITIAVSIGRFVMMLFVANDISIYIWATAEFCIAIMIVALTALRPLLRQISGKISGSLASSEGKSRLKMSTVNHGSQPGDIRVLSGQGMSCGEPYYPSRPGVRLEDYGTDESQVELTTTMERERFQQRRMYQI